ncbi:unnamed protein product [Schistosoma mattheei]|uniref:Uncharacterized protein n=1 Tax=Schistosoma mattheei TaxID=31246 RepID=A0A183PZM1_9TREM|nr:unnamed protein product [Schistosoma mattheei]
MVADDQQLIHMPFVSSRFWSPCAPLVWNQGFPTSLDGSSIFTNSVKARDIRFLSSQFRKQHPPYEKFIKTKYLDLIRNLELKLSAKQKEELTSCFVNIFEKLPDLSVAEFLSVLLREDLSNNGRLFSSHYFLLLHYVLENCVFHDTLCLKEQ